jgi:integrase
VIEVMPKPRPPYLHRERNRHGKYVWYVRTSRASPRIRIDEEFGTAEFMQAYHEAIAGNTPKKLKLKVRHGSLEWLANQWKESSDWHLTKDATKRQRANILDRIVAENGDVPFREITEAHIADGRERRMATPAAANNFVKTLRALFKWACEDGRHASYNPAAGVKLFAQSADGFKAWTESDVAKFRDRWALDTRERLAMELLLHTGLRRGDAVRLGRQHIRDGVAHIRAEKTGEPLAFPILEPLAIILSNGPVGELNFIASADRQPMTKESFGNWFHDACKAAGVIASAHGLRKLAATVAAQDGATEKELQAWFGWKTNFQSQVYTRKANRETLAKSLGEKLSKNTYSHTSEKVRALPRNKLNKTGV